MIALGIHPDRAPAESTIPRLTTHLDPDTVDAVIGGVMWAATRHIADRPVIAIHGNTVRGASRAATSGMLRGLFLRLLERRTMSAWCARCCA